MHDEIRKVYSNYMETRKNMTYYKYIRSLIAMCSINATSILDVGSAGIDLLSHCSNVPEKYSIDLNFPLIKEGITAIKEDFFKYETNQKFDIVCCFQVLEHIQEAEKFCQKLVDLAKNEIIISVPYMWDNGRSKSHIQDPVDLHKIVKWFGCEPIFCHIIEERLIAVFLKNKENQRLLCEQNDGFFSEFYKNYLFDIANTQFRVPFEKIGKHRKIILYGGGKIGQEYYKQLKNRNDYELILWVDKNYSKYQEKGYEMYAPECIRTRSYDVVLIAVNDYKIAQSIARDAVELGVNREKIIW